MGSGADETRIDADFVRVARALRLRGGLRSIGLVPTTARTDLAPVVLGLGVALAGQTGAVVAVVDATGVFAGLGDASSEPEEEATAFASIRWLHPSVSLLSPKTAASAHTRLHVLEHLLDAFESRYAHVLVDLSGFDQTGDLLGAVRRVSGTVLVGRAGRTSERDLGARAAQIPEDRRVGVLLIS